MKRLKVWGDKDTHRGSKWYYIKSLFSPLCYMDVRHGPYLPESNVKNLEVFQMRCLRRLCGFSLFDRIPFIEVCAKCQVLMIAKLLRYRRLRWLGHVARMDNVRLPLQMMFSTMTGSGARGRPLKSWYEYVLSLIHI